MRDRILDFIGNYALVQSSDPSGMGSVCQRICQLPQTIANTSATAEEARRQSRGVRSIENARSTTYQPDINLTEISTDNTSTNVDISEGTARHISMITPLQKQQLEEQSYMNNKYLSQKSAGAKEKSSSDNTLGFKDAGAGELCEICNLHHKTHFAIPCGHSACLTCWSRWLYSKPVTNINSAEEERRNENCFVCHRKVSKIKRYSFSVVPLKLYENRVLDFSTTELNGFADSISSEANVQAAAIAERLAKDESLEILQIAVEDSLERVVRSLLEVKDDLLENVVKRLEEAELHLFNLVQPSSLTALDAYASVLAVECVSVNELFRQYHKLFEHGSKWQALELEVEKLRSAVERVGKCLDSTDFEAELQGPNSAKTQNELSEVESILEICLAPTSIKVQWNQVKDLIHKSSGEYHLVPAILNVFENGGGVTASIFNAKQIRETLFYAEVKRDQMENLFTDLLLEDIPLMLSKLSLVTTAVKKATLATSVNS